MVENTSIKKVAENLNIPTWVIRTFGITAIALIFAMGGAWWQIQFQASTIEKHTPQWALVPQIDARLRVQAVEIVQLKRDNRTIDRTLIELKKDVEHLRKSQERIERDVNRKLDDQRLLSKEILQELRKDRGNRRRRIGPNP